MSAGTTFWTKSFDAFCDLAANFIQPGDSTAYLTRVNKGYTRYADNENLDSIVTGMTPYTQGILSVWIKDYEIEQNIPHDFNCNGELLIFVPKDTSIDMNQIHDGVINLISELVNEDNYDESAGDLTHCRTIKSVFKEIRIVDAGGIAIFDWGTYGSGNISFIDP